MPRPQKRQQYEKCDDSKVFESHRHSIERWKLLSLKCGTGDSGYLRTLSLTASGIDLTLVRCGAAWQA